MRGSSRKYGPVSSIHVLSMASSTENSTGSLAGTASSRARRDGMSLLMRLSVPRRCIETVSGRSGILQPGFGIVGLCSENTVITRYPPQAAVAYSEDVLASTAPSARQEPRSASVVVIMDVDGILRHGDVRTLADARPALRVLGDSTVVLSSSRPGAEVRALQRELGIRHPFISDGGAALHIPHGYFCGTVLDAGEDGFETIDFGVRRLGHAVRLLVALFRSCPVPPVVVGIGFEWRDRVLLREVDVPIVLRDPGLDQSTLVRNVPHAFVTDGWNDARLTGLLLRDGSVGPS